MTLDEEQPVMFPLSASSVRSFYYGGPGYDAAYSDRQPTDADVAAAAAGCSFHRDGGYGYVWDCTACNRGHDPAAISLARLRSYGRPGVRPARPAAAAVQPRKPWWRRRGWAVAAFRLSRRGKGAQ